MSDGAGGAGDVSRIHGSAVGTVSGKDVRAHLGLTPWQLRELTSELDIDVGERPNYPQYRFVDFHRLATFQLLREIQVPLDVARQAMDRYADEVAAGRGWLGLTAMGETWSVVLVRSPHDLVSWVRLSFGRGCVVDLEYALSRTRERWAALPH